MKFVNHLRVYQYLQLTSNNPGIVEELKRILTCWDYKSTATINDFEDDIEQVVGEIRDGIFPYINGDKINESICSFIHYTIYDHVSSLIKEKFIRDDLNIYKNSREFCKNNGSPKQLGATFYNFIPHSAVVELSMLNNKRTPMEKLNCLRSAFDHIFAEVKGDLISVISKYSEKEIDVPLVNNKEIIPIVMAVIFKSKLFYFRSDMHYIALFGNSILNKDKNLREIYQVFEESLGRICAKSQEPATSNEKFHDKLGVCETITFIQKVATDNTNIPTVFEEQKRRVANLITSATTENLI